MTKLKFITNIDDYESHFENFINNLLNFLYTKIYQTNQNHVMIDVGAHEGVITKILLNHIHKTSGKIIAIDAHPDWLNKFAYANEQLVEKYNVGCYSIPSIKKFVAEKTLTGTGFLGLPPNKTSINFERLKTFQIECNTLDNLITLDNQVSFIKIDAESADFEVLLGGKNIIKKHRPFIVFEFSGQIFERAHSHTREDFFNFFKSINYSLYSVGLGKTEEQISKLWDTYTPEFKDILAVPSEYNNLIK